MEIGLIHIYCGDGKGKTSAAMGLGLRAVGHGKKVLLSEFFHVVKGEPAKKFVWNMTEEEKAIVKIEHTNRFKAVTKKAVEEDYDVLILDELIATVNLDFVPVHLVVDFLKNKPTSLEVVMTGRNPKVELVELAHYVSEIKAVKHPFTEGIPARVGIEI